MESYRKAFKLERVKYRQMLTEAMKVKIAEKVNECEKMSRSYILWLTI